MQIGIAGVGRMGAAIAAHLVEVGHQVTVWNRSADKVKPLAGGRHQGREDTGRARQRRRGHHHHSHRCRRDRRGLWRAAGPARGQRQGQAVHRNEHGAAGNRDRAGREGSRQGRGLRRMSGRRLGRSGAAGQAARARGRGSRPISPAPSRSSISCAGASSIAGRSARAQLMKFAVNLPLMIYWQALGEALALCRDAQIRSGAD